MIINIERRPEFSLYYIGGIILKLLKTQNIFEIDELFYKVKEQIGIELPIDYYYYALDWLYILTCVELKEGKLVYVSKNINCI